MSAKTHGQRMYEYYHPSHIKVVRFEARHFATEADVFLVPNPAEPTPWRFLTEACRQSWEKTAQGHHIFTNERRAASESQDE